MKLFKKWICLGLCATMVVPLASCFAKDGESGSSVGESGSSVGESSKIDENSSIVDNSSGVGESSGNDDSSSSVDTPTAEELAAIAQAKAYVDGAKTTLENAKSFKLTLVTDKTSEYESFAEGTTEIDPEMNESYFRKTTTEITFTEDGEGVALYVVSTNESNGGYIFISETIYKGEAVYTRSYEMEDSETEPPLWGMTGVEGVESNSAMGMSLPVDLIPKLLNTKEVEDAVKMLLEGLEDSVSEEILAGNVTDGKVVIEYDYKEEAIAWMDYFNSIDETKDTLGGVLNTVISKLAPGLTAEGILGQLSAYSAMTLSEALTSFDAFLGEMYGTSLQQIKDAVVNSEIMGVLFEKYIGEENAEKIDAIKAWKVESLKTGEYGSKIVGDLINEYLRAIMLPPPSIEGSTETVIVESTETVTEGSAEPVDYVKNALDFATQALGKTFEELGIMANWYEGIQLQAYGGNTSLTFDSANALQEWSVYFEEETTGKTYDFYYEDDVEKMIHCGYETHNSKTTLTLSEISSSTATIEAPSEDEIVKCINLSGDFCEDESLRVNSTTSGVSGYLELRVEESGEMMYWVNFETDEVLEEYGQTLTVKVTNAAGWNAGIHQSATYTYFEYNEVAFQLILNEDRTYKVIGFPTQEEIVDWYNNVYDPEQYQ